MPEGTLCDLEAESRLVGGLLLDNGMITHCGQVVPEDFSSEICAESWRVILECSWAGISFDEETLIDKLTTRGLSLDFSVALEWMHNAEPASVTRCRNRAEIIVRLAQRRRLAKELERFQTAIYDRTISSAAIAEGMLAATALLHEKSDGIRQPEDVPDVFSLDAREISYLVPDLIPKGAVTLLTGSPGEGKSSLALGMTASCARGREFIARPCEQIECLYIDKENPLALVQHRMNIIAGGPVPKLTIWGGWNKQEPPSIEDPLLLKWATERRLLIVFDSLVRFHDADENSASEMRNVMAHARRLADVGGTVLLLHHRSKTEANKYRGSSDILAAVDVAYSLETVDGGLRLHRFKSRFSSERIFPLRADFAAGTFELLEDSDTERTNDVEAIRGVITDAPGLMARAIYDAVQKRGVSKSRAAAVLERETGRLWRWEDGPNRSHRYYLLAGVPGVPPYKAAEHRNIPCSTRSVSVPGTPEHLDNKVDGKLVLVACSMFRDACSETQHSERQDPPLDPITEPPPHCYVHPANTTEWWRRGDGEMVCNRCYPNPNGKLFPFTLGGLHPDAGELDSTDPDDPEAA